MVPWNLSFRQSRVIVCVIARLGVLIETPACDGQTDGQTEERTETQGWRTKGPRHNIPHEHGVARRRGKKSARNSFIYPPAAGGAGAWV